MVGWLSMVEEMYWAGVIEETNSKELGRDIGKKVVDAQHWGHKWIMTHSYKNWQLLKFMFIKCLFYSIKVIKVL